MATPKVSPPSIQVARNSLPVSLTPLLGREQEVETICALIRRTDVRLVTLTGPGGVGKTRLGVQIADNLFSDFVDGVYFVSLAPLRDPDLVIPTIIQTLGLQMIGASPPLELLKAYLQEKHVLLLLDNFEQVISALSSLSLLLTTCSRLKILVTSRVVLHMYGEYQYPVPPLALPRLIQLPECNTLQEYAAIALFVQRAQAVKPNFQLNDANARIIAEICTRLDGLPLAIELAAARSKLFSPQALLARLQQCLPLLTQGVQDGPARQKTLRDTIAWSYNLLTSQEQRLFCQLAVFVGGCTLSTIEAVCCSPDDKEGQIIENVTSLLDKSLLWQIEREGQEPRLRLFETIREYGLEALEAAGEKETTQRTHAEHYLALAQAANADWKLHVAQWLGPLEQERENLRTALQWALQQDKKELELALRVSGSLWWFWGARGPVSEGRNFYEKALALTQNKEVEAYARAQALYGATVMAFYQDDIRQAELYCRESLTLFKQVGDKEGTANCLYRMAQLAIVRGNNVLALPLAEEALVLYTEMDNLVGIPATHLRLGEIALAEGNLSKARSHYGVSLSIRKKVNDKWGLVNSFRALGSLAIIQNDFAEAAPLIQEGLALARELDTEDIPNLIGLAVEVSLWQGDFAKGHALAEEALMRRRGIRSPSGTAWALVDLARVEVRQEQYIGAYSHFQESLLLTREVTIENYRQLIAFCLEGLAEIAVAQNEPTRAARLWGAAQVAREGLGTGNLGGDVPFYERPHFERAVATAQTSLGKQAFDSAWAEGRTMSLAQALAANDLVTVAPPSTPAPSPTLSAKAKPVYPDELTAREVDVLHVLAQGLTDIQIAEKLFVSPRTVNWHLTSLYRKIQVTSRAAATRYAIEHHLA